MPVFDRRRGRCVVGLAGLALLLVSNVGHAAGGDLPVRKPGQWRITSISEVTGMVTFDACIGPGDSIAAVSSQGECGDPDVRRTADEVIVNVTCSTPQGREKTSTLFTGDFSTWYRGIVKMSSDPPTPGHAFVGVTLDAKYLGPCAAAGPAQAEKAR
jgi:hypothetical protein